MSEMNRIFTVLILLFFFSCNKEKEPFTPLPTSEKPNLETGKKIFNGKGQCATCHKTSQNVLGPSIAEIVSKYEEKQTNMIDFLKGNLDPIVDPSQFEIMKINLEITKKMTDQELQSVVDYMQHISLK